MSISSPSADIFNWKMMDFRDVSERKMEEAGRWKEPACLRGHQRVPSDGEYSLIW